jgi:hypothetical protein
VELDPAVDWVGVERLINQIRSQYPNWAWMLEVPDLANIIVRAGVEQWDEDRVEAAIQATPWWKERNLSARKFAELEQTDPAEAEKQAQALKTQILQFVRTNGMDISDAEASFIARASLQLGRTQQEWQSSVLEFLTDKKGQVPGPTIDGLRAMAAQYAIPLSDVTLKKWASDILAGMVDENTFRSYLIEQAKSMFPGLANALDRGLTVEQYVAPYKEVAVQELGINPNSIDWTDPKWAPLIQRSDGKGGFTALTLHEARREIRTNPVYGWDYTPNAQESATTLSQALLERLGRAA